MTKPVAADSMDSRERLFAKIVERALLDLAEPAEAEASRWFLSGSLVLELYELGNAMRGETEHKSDATLRG